MVFSDSVIRNNTTTSRRSSRSSSLPVEVSPGGLKWIEDPLTVTVFRCMTGRAHTVLENITSGCSELPKNLVPNSVKKRAVEIAGIRLQPRISRGFVWPNTLPRRQHTRNPRIRFVRRVDQCDFQRFRPSAERSTRQRWTEHRSALAEERSLYG